jgi:predicted transcriptional regulator
MENEKKVTYIPEKLSERLSEYGKKMRVTATAVYLHLVIECSKNNTHETDLTDEQLSQIVGVSLSTIRRSLTKLDKYNFIKRKRIGVRRKITLLDY